MHLNIVSPGMPGEHYLGLSGVQGLTSEWGTTNDPEGGGPGTRQGGPQREQPRKAGRGLGSLE